MFRRLRAGEKPGAHYDQLRRERARDKRRDNPVKAMKRRVRFSAGPDISRPGSK